jgi:toxin CcdB
MARFDVYRNPAGAGCLLDIQADLLSHLNTRVVVPLLPLSSAPQPARSLNPGFDIAEETLVMCTQFMAAVPANILKNPLASLSGRRDDIVAAIDLLMQGF